jgi:hypothetical protein
VQVADAPRTAPPVEQLLTFIKFQLEMALLFHWSLL